MKTIIKEKLPLILAIVLICSPLLDVLTALTVTAGFPISIGVVCRALFMAAAFFYVVFWAKFPEKKYCLAILGVLCAYLLAFMAHLFLTGGLSLCLHNVQETAKTYFAPIIIVFLYAVYKEYGQILTTQSIAIAGAIYTSIILIAYLTGTSFISYADSGYGYCGWFFAANEVGCIVSITAPITIYYCLTILPTVDTWWKKLFMMWTFATIIFSANFIGTKVVFLFVLTYCIAAFLWMFISGKQKKLSPWGIYRRRSACILGVMVLILVGLYAASPLSEYLENIYTEIMKEDSVIRAISTNQEKEADSANTWMRSLLENNKSLDKLDQILSRRLTAASPSIEVFIESDFAGKLFGIGYATAGAYSRTVDYMIEMDFIAVLIRHGIVGFTVYAMPYLVFIGWAIINFFAHIKKNIINFRYCTYLFSTLAAFAIAFVAGHALVSPAVATFSIVVSMNLWTGVKEKTPAFSELKMTSANLQKVGAQQENKRINYHKVAWSR